eukprot:6236403-Prymnesium_polylepis.2
MSGQMTMTLVAVVASFPVEIVTVKLPSTSVDLVEARTARSATMSATNFVWASRQNAAPGAGLSRL